MSYEDPKTLVISPPQTLEHQQLSALHRIEGLLTGLLTATQTLADALRPTPDTSPVKEKEAKVVTRRGR